MFRRNCFSTLSSFLGFAVILAVWLLGSSPRSVGASASGLIGGNPVSTRCTGCVNITQSCPNSCQTAMVACHYGAGNPRSCTYGAWQKCNAGNDPGCGQDNQKLCKSCP